GRPGSAIQVGVVESFGLGYAAIYLGIAEAALDFAIDYAKKRVVKPENIAVAQDPTVQRHIGGLAVRLDAARLLLEDSAARWETADLAERGNLANKAKFLATETSLEVTSKVIQVVGGRGAYKDYPAERAFRDVRTATLMPPTVDRMLETIGKSALGIQEGMFRIGGGPQGACASEGEGRRGSACGTVVGLLVTMLVLWPVVAAAQAVSGATADERAINGAKAYMKSKGLTSLKLNMMMPSIFTAGSTGEMANFEKETGIGVNYFEVGILQIQAKAMSEAVAKSGSFDFWIGDPISLPDLAEAGLVRPLDDLVARGKPDFDDVVAGFVEQGRYKGKTYGMFGDGDNW